ncbi:hypothetical protein MMC17_002292 [Xylographa soralifera]|nr:hypothetical protein [Xylographa soralifera]
MSTSASSGISTRRLSKRAPELNIDELYKERKQEILEYHEKTDTLKGGLHATRSFDATYWQNRTAVAQSLVRQTVLNRKISIAKLANETHLSRKESTEVFEQTEDAQSSRELEQAQLMDQRLCERQSERLAKPGFASAVERAWVKFYTSSTLGLGIKAFAAGDRKASDQSKFRKELEEVSDQMHPDPKRKGYWWCPITRSYHPSSAMKAAHLYPWKSGQDAMIAIFGEDGNDELFSARNGLLLSTSAETYLDNGAIALVPAIDDESSSEQIEQWNTASVKEYKLRILRPKEKGMDESCNYSSDLTWKELDNQPVAFRSEYRPRARYLYYAYCVALLRLAYNVEKRPVALKSSLGKKYWGTTGEYLKKSMIRGFVDAVGHEFDDLMEDSLSDDEDESDPTILASANAQILRSHAEQDTELPVLSTVEDDEEESETTAEE